jgi:uncharacterized protein YfaQ (DUF2300 family)
VQKIGFECKVIGMSDRFLVSRLVARQPKEHGIPELAVLRRAGLWDGWLRQEKILWLGSSTSASAVLERRSTRCAWN